MNKYGVSCTIIYNGYVEIEAESEDEALKMAEEQMNFDNLADLPNDVKVGNIDFSFGEATADYADEI